MNIAIHLQAKKKKNDEKVSQSSLAFRVGHCHVQVSNYRGHNTLSTVVDIIHNCTRNGKNKIKIQNEFITYMNFTYRNNRT